MKKAIYLLTLNILFTLLILNGELRIQILHARA